MPYLTWISDNDLRQIIKGVLDVGIKKKSLVNTQFQKNVIDPFSAIFEASAFTVDHQTWKDSEMIRQCQKTLQNHIGDLHQKILGQVIGWVNLKVGSASGVDLENKNKRIIAEVKNKHNTISLGSLGEQYDKLAKLVNPKASKYFGYTVYFVNIIPKKPLRFNEPFTPNDKTTGSKCAVNSNIRIIDGASFYELVTGDKNALKDLYKVLPLIIEDIFQKDYKQSTFKIPDKLLFEKYFTDAFG